jgi:flagellar biosynthesis protein FlhB
VPAGYDQERTEAATPRRREQARQEGQVAKSREAVSAALFLSMILFLSIAGTALAEQIVTLTQETFATLGEVETSLSGLHLFLARLLVRTVVMLLPMFLTVCVFAVGANVMQTGFLVSTKALQPKLEHLDPRHVVKRLFSMQSLFELGKALVKVGIVGAIVYTTIAGDMAQIFPLGGLGVADIVSYIGSSTLRLGVRTSYAIIILAVLDYLWQRWQYEKSLRMTLQEVKDERKQQEGDPHIRARIRSIMREMARRRMMEDVPKADVVITNPTHIAVALHYRRDTMPAPKVLAKGAGYLAERMKAIAQEHTIPCIENRVVAQRLFKTVDIGEYIPETLYKAVADILAYVYRIRPPATG